MIKFRNVHQIIPCLPTYDEIVAQLIEFRDSLYLRSINTIDL
jgi:hypothetical protein